MKPVVKLLAVATIGGMLGLFSLPLLVAAVLAGEVHQASQLAAEWDIPAEVVPALQAAGERWSIPWFLLAGIASVATDFARHAPDGLPRGATVATAIFPVVTPPIAGAGAGMFLALGVPGDAQDVRDEADWLAGRLAQLAHAPGGPQSLANPAATRFWHDVIVAAPLAISSVAPTDDSPGGDGSPLDSGGNPIRQFGGAVLNRIAAPVSAGNLDAFSAWAAGEGTCARFNPLATTQPEPGAWPFNTLSGGSHVWNYPTFAVGVRATTTALTNGLYQRVILAFQASAGVAAVADAVEQSPWGTKHFGSTSYAGRQCPDGGSAPVGPPPTLPTVTGPDTVAATIVARAIRYQEIWSEMAVLPA